MINEGKSKRCRNDGVLSQILLNLPLLIHKYLLINFSLQTFSFFKCHLIISSLFQMIFSCGKSIIRNHLHYYIIYDIFVLWTLTFFLLFCRNEKQLLWKEVFNCSSYCFCFLFIYKNIRFQISVKEKTTRRKFSLIKEKKLGDTWCRTQGPSDLRSNALPLSYIPMGNYSYSTSNKPFFTQEIAHDQITKNNILI